MVLSDCDAVKFGPPIFRLRIFFLDVFPPLIPGLFNKCAVVLIHSLHHLELCNHHTNVCVHRMLDRF